jgi:lipid II:glycine glycyltransferase (peptidoglycan interpeptide bridge formation enzyme)
VFDENDRMWGVYKFKEGLGGKVIQTVGALDYPASKFKYKIVQNVLPQILTVTRKIRRRQIQNELTD